MSGLPSFDPTLQLALALALALLLATSAWQKLRAPRFFSASLASYRLVPERTVAVASVLVIATELALAVALVVGLVLPLVRPIAALGAVCLLAVYSGAILLNLLRGRRDIDCGCSGPGARRPISPGLLVRNGLFVTAAIVCALPHTGRVLVWLDALSIAGAVAALALLFVAAERVSSQAMPRLADRRGAS